MSRTNAGDLPHHAVADLITDSGHDSVNRTLTKAR
jgi:hypothetical protein